MLVTLHILVCFVLIIVIMLQSGNAADLAGAFGGAGSQTAFGPRGAATFLSRATTWCAIVFMMTSLALSVQAHAGVGGSPARSCEQTSQPRSTPCEAGATAPACARMLRRLSRRKLRPSSGSGADAAHSSIEIAASATNPVRIASSIAVVAELADAPA